MRNALLRLQKQYDNFKVHIHPNNHSKFVLVDGRKCFISTKNYSKPDSFPESIEIGILQNNLAVDVYEIWKKLISETDTPIYLQNKNEYYHKLMSINDLNPYHKDLYIWIWTPAKAVYNWIHGPPLKEIIEKIENTSYLDYYQLKGGNKIVSIYHNFRPRIGIRLFFAGKFFLMQCSFRKMEMRTPAILSI